MVFDFARGDLECLRSGIRVSETCDAGIALECGGADAAAPDPAVPALGEGYWYLARVMGDTWNPAGAYNTTTYDPMPPDITACP